MGKETLVSSFSLSQVIKRKGQWVGLVPEMKILCGNCVKIYKVVEMLGQTKVRVTDGIFQTIFAGLRVLPLSLLASAEHLWK